MCDRDATEVRPTCDRYATEVRPRGGQDAKDVPSMCDHDATTMRSRCDHDVVVVAVLVCSRYFYISLRTPMLNNVFHSRGATMDARMLCRTHGPCISGDVGVVSYHPAAPPPSVPHCRQVGNIFKHASAAGCLCRCTMAFWVSSIFSSRRDAPNVNSRSPAIRYCRTDVYAPMLPIEERQQ